ncbi:MAG: hypothetical protein ACRDHG_01915, partial [Anaerolineales bacterium]
MVFWKKGNPKPDLDFRPLAWCSRCEKQVNAVQSWKNPQRRWGRYGQRGQYLYRCPTCTETIEPFYYAAWNAIDWSIEAPRIGDREEHGLQPLKENTLRRIGIGLERYGRQPLLIQLDRTHAQNNRAFSLLGPVPTQTTQQNLAFLGIYGPEGQRKVVDLKSAMPVLTTTPTFGLVIRMKGDIEAAARGLEGPLPTLTTVGAPAFIVSMRGESSHGHSAISINDPLPTQTTEGAPFIVEMHGSNNARGIDQPLHYVLAGGNHHGLVMPFIGSYYGGSDVIRPISEALPTATTIDRLSLTVPQEELRIEDCGFRMLQPHEIQDAMGFRPDYVLLGTKKERVKLAGNAVTPPVME